KNSAAAQKCLETPRGGETSDVLLEDIEIQGILKHVGLLSFNGKLTGVICSQTGDIRIGKNAKICGELVSHSALIAGKISGSMTIHGSCQLTPTAEVLGDITSPRLDIADGATFIGKAEIVPSAFRIGLANQ